MAADAIARQYDVDKNRLTLVCETESGNYRPGTITFFPKPGKSLDLRKMEESLRATRLSGGTSMSMSYLEITVLGELIVKDDAVQLKGAGTAQQFLLKQAKDDKNGSFNRLREVAAAGAKIVSVTGHVDGWSGRFPLVLSALAKRSTDEPMVLVVADFEISKK